MKWLTTIGVHVYELWVYRHEPEYLRTLADVYWHALLILSTGLIAGALLYGGVKLLSTLQEVEGGGLLPSEGGGVTLNRDELEATLEGFAAREATYEFLKKNPPKVTDPSR